MPRYIFGDECDGTQSLFNTSIGAESATDNKQDNAQAIFWLEKAARQGKRHSQFQVGWKYDDGNGVERGYQQAMYWYQRAADQNSSNACVNIGWMYKKGHGVEIDYATALSWFQRAAEDDNVVAWYNLAIMYHKGQGTDVDYRQALAWYQKVQPTGRWDVKDAILKPHALFADPPNGAAS